MSGDRWHDHVDATWNPRRVTHGMSHVVHLCEWFTWSQVSRGGNMGKENKKKKSKEKCERDKWQGGKWGEVSPTYGSVRLM